MNVLHRIGALTAGAAMAAALGGCAYNEALGRSQFLLVDEASLTQSAAQAWQQTLRTERISRDPVYNVRVQEVGSRIVHAAGLDSQRWEYVVFDNPDVNAFVLPGGRVGVNTGLLQLVRNDDQLAAVIGHETGHVIAHHAAERYSQQVGTQIALIGAQGALGTSSQFGRAIGSYGGIGAQLGILLPFSRKHELEADRIGVDLMQRAGYDPRQAVELWRMMAARGANGPPQFASTHPSDATRVAALQEYLRSRGWA